MNRLRLYIGSRHEGAHIFILHIWRVGDQGSWGETWDSKVTASRWAHLNLCVTALWLTDRPANHNVEHYSEEDDGHGRGDSDQHYLTVLTRDGKGCGERQREREISDMYSCSRLINTNVPFYVYDIVHNSILHTNSNRNIKRHSISPCEKEVHLIILCI